MKVARSISKYEIRLKIDSYHDTIEALIHAANKLDSYMKDCEPVRQIGLVSYYAERKKMYTDRLDRSYSTLIGLEDQLNGVTTE